MTSVPSAAARTIAAGGNPLFEKSFVHHEHGDLVFRGRLPLAMDSMRHSVAIDNLMQDLADGAEPSLQTRILAAAIAGMTVPAGAPAGKGLMLELPAISETPDPDDEGRIIRRFYDPATEAEADFLIGVWIAFSNWRGELLSDKTVDAVGESSGDPVTSSGASSTQSAAATASPSPIPAS